MGRVAGRQSMIAGRRIMRRQKVHRLHPRRINPVAGGPAYNIRSNYTPYQLGQTVSKRGWRSWMANPFGAPVPASR